jgi:molecular chaperone HscB
MQNYFFLFDLSPSFDIDSTLLEQKYFESQRLAHPDRMVGKGLSALEQTSRSMLINEAYDALKSPLKRAQHLLALQGVWVGSKQDTLKPSQALLIETMESREALSEAKTQEELSRLESENKNNKKEVVKELSQAFKTETWQKAGELTLRLGYLLKLDEELRIRKKALSA